MITIYIEPNDKADLVELLDYALKKKIEEGNFDRKGNWNDSGYWKIRIPQLKRLVGGSNPHDLIQRSTCGYVVSKPTKRGKK